MTKLNWIAITLAMQLLVAVAYGMRLFNEWGTDYGIYYVGANATNQSDYGLYADFFDFKGPAYYGFLKFLGHFLPYSLTGAVIALVITAFLWFLSINIISIFLKLEPREHFIIGLASIAILIGQDSNSSLSLYQSAFTISALFLLLMFLKYENISLLILSTFFLSHSVLCKIDSIPIIAFALYVMLKVKSLKLLKMLFFYILFFAFFFLTQLILFSKYLKFDLLDYFYQAVQYVGETRWSVGSSGSLSALKNFIVRDYYSFSLILSSSVFFILISYLQGKKKKDLLSDPVFILFGSGLLNYLLLQSDKNYHLFVLFPYVILAAAIAMKDSFVQLNLRVIGSVLVLSSSLVLWNYLDDARCSITKNVQCSNPYADLKLNKSKDHLARSFYLNQGWPYVVNGVLPKVNFTVWWPLAVETKKASSQIISQANSSLEISIYVDYNDFIDLQKRNPQLTSKFISGRKLVQPKYGEQWAELRPLSSK